MTTDATSATDEATSAIAAAADTLRQFRDLRDAVEPVRRLIAQMDEDIRAAAQAAATAGLSERMIATLAGASQPSVHGWLDERRGAPLPPASLAADVWALHTIASALTCLIRRLEGRHLPELAPTPYHCRPVDAARRSRESMKEVVNALGSLGAALDYDQV